MQNISNARVLKHRIIEVENALWGHDGISLKVECILENRLGRVLTYTLSFEFSKEPQHIDFDYVNLSEFDAENIEFKAKCYDKAYAFETMRHAAQCYLIEYERGLKDGSIKIKPSKKQTIIY